MVMVIALMKMVLLYDNYKGYRDLKTLPTGTARRAYLPRSYVKENHDFPDVRRYLRSTWQPTRLSEIRGNLPVFTARVSGNLLVALYGTVYLKVSNYDDNWDNGDGCGDLNDDSDNDDDDDDDDDVEVKYKDRSLLLRVLLIMNFIVILAMIFDANKNDDQNNL